MTAIFKPAALGNTLADIQHIVDQAMDVYQGDVGVAVTPSFIVVDSRIREPRSHPPLEVELLIVA